MKKSKLRIILIAVFVVIAIAVGSVAAVYSQLEENPVTDGKIVKHIDDNTIEYGEKTFKKGNTVTVSDKRLSECLLMLDANSGVVEIYDSKYAPLIEKEEKTNYYLRHLSEIIVEKNTLSKSNYTRSAYSANTYTLPELKAENIKRIQVCFGDYYDSAENVIDSFSSGVAATVEGDCPVFDIRAFHELSDEKEIKNFVREFDKTGGLEDLYDYWSEQSGRENIFFKVVFYDNDFPCSLLFTKDAINID